MRTPADRQRDRRRRRREGVIVVKVEVRPEARETLADARWIGAWDIDDREKVSEAVQRLIDGIRL